MRSAWLLFRRVQDERNWSWTEHLPVHHPRVLTLDAIHFLSLFCVFGSFWILCLDICCIPCTSGSKSSFPAIWDLQVYRFCRMLSCYVATCPEKLLLVCSNLLYLLFWRGPNSQAWAAGTRHMPKCWEWTTISANHSPWTV